jgi:hypothetical protein
MVKPHTCKKGTRIALGLIVVVYHPKKTLLSTVTLHQPLNAKLYLCTLPVTEDGELFNF